MTALHLVRLVLCRRGLLRHARFGRDAARDDGYVIHAGLAAVFAESAERPADIPLHNFVVDDVYAETRQDPEHAYLLGYSDCDEAVLRDRMAPDAAEIVRQCVTRAVPRIDVGRRVAYRARVCPVVRTRLAPLGEPEVPRGPRKSRELDAWLAHRIREGWTEQPPGGSGTSLPRQGAEWREREGVYGAWLERELGRDGAATSVEPPRMTRYQRAPLYRRGRRHRVERPDVVLEGTLEVADDDAFMALLRRGVGRHRAFGFGTLLVRPA